MSGGPKEIDFLDWMTRTSLELIGEAGMGYSFHTIPKGSVNMFADAVKNLVYAVAPLDLFSR